jgi:hypothetical protein
MKAIKTIALLLILGVVMGDLNFQLPEFLKEGLNYLFNLNDQYPITIDKCSDNPIYDARTIKVDPPYVTADSSITIKVAGIMSSDQHVKDLNVTTYLNGQLLQPTIDPKDADVKKGQQYIWSYYASTPGSILQGQWQTFLRLQNSDDEELCCIRASWDVPEVK